MASAAPAKTLEDAVKNAAEALSVAHQACLAHKPGAEAAAEAAEEEATLRLEAAVAASKAVSPWITWSPEQIANHNAYWEKVWAELPAKKVEIEALAAALDAAKHDATSVPRI